MKTCKKARNVVIYREYEDKTNNEKYIFGSPYSYGVDRLY